MSDTQTPPTTEQTNTADAWREVGQEFQTLGASLLAAARATWQSEENRRRVQEMRANLEVMAKEIGQALQETVTSPQAQQVRTDAGKVVESVRGASTQTAMEVRDRLLTLLRQANSEVQRLIPVTSTGKTGEGTTVNVTEVPPEGGETSATGNPA